jgi:hypothetical protein
VPAGLVGERQDRLAEGGLALEILEVLGVEVGAEAD